MLVPRKIEKARSNKRIQTHLNLIQMGLNWDLVKGRSKNVRTFVGAPEYDERIYGKVGEQELR